MSTASSATPDPFDRDPGLQAERTALSWNRTSLSVAVNALLLLRAGWTSGQVAFTIAGVILMVAAAAALVYGSHRRRELVKAGPPRGSHPIPVFIAALVTVLACCAGVASILVTG